jgi:hypothetical protein
MEFKSNYDEKWELAGEIGVDAGLCWIGDPCYLKYTPLGENMPDEAWHEFLEQMYKLEEESGHPGLARWKYPAGHEGVGITSMTGHGDGLYPVYVRKDNGCVAELRIVFIPPETFEPEEEDDESDSD